MLELVLREFPIDVGFAARLDKQITRITRFFVLALLIVSDNSLIARYNYVLKTNYLFIHYTMLRVTNMVSAVILHGKQTSAINALSRPAVRVMYHPVVSRAKT